jgi:hypothetical protein
VRRGSTIAVAALLLGCGGREVAPQILAQTPDDRAEDAGEIGVDALVARDERTAVDALDRAISGSDDAASLAAGYALRLGIATDTHAVGAAIRRGASSGDDLVAALSWRWIAAGGLGAPPGWRGKKPEDPAVGALAAAAFVLSGARLPQPLEDALGLPEPAASDRDPAIDRDRIAALLREAVPFDGGALGLALAFAEARRERWVDAGSRGAPAFAAVRLRVEMLAAIAGGKTAAPGLDGVRPARDPMYSRLASRLDSRLLRAPLPLLRQTAVRGEGALRVDALRALAVSVKRPVAGDLGAAAAALSSDDALTRVEAARTYLLLAGKAAKP